jgi:hypothetical protein
MIKETDSTGEERLILQEKEKEKKMGEEVRGKEGEKAGKKGEKK